MEVVLRWIPREVGDAAGLGATGSEPESLRELFSLARQCLEVVDRRSPSHARACFSAVLSLAEAESLRRHLALRAAGAPSQVDSGCIVDVVTPLGLALTPVDPGAACPPQLAAHTREYEDGEQKAAQAPLPVTLESEGVLSFSELRQCARYFDGQLWFTDDEVIDILRALADSAESQRRQAFEVLLNSKRRDRCAWDGTPVAQVFAHADASMLIRLRGLVSKVKAELARRELSLRDAFAMWDANNDGWLSQGELYSALQALIPNLSEQDVAELLHHGDSTGDGFLDCREFAAEFGSGSEEDAALARAAAISRRRIRGSDVQQKVSTLKQLQGLTDDRRAGQTEASASPLPTVKAAANTWQSIAALGTLSLTSGGFVQFHGDGRVSTLPGYRPTIKPRFVNLTSGCWYWEVTVVVAGRASVGWATCSFQGDSHLCIGVGDDENSWGFDGYSRKLLGWGGSKKFGLHWSPGDVVGVAVDLSKHEVQWSINGDRMGQPARLPSHVKGLVPAVSFDSAFQFLVNLGRSPFRYRPPEGCRSVWSWVAGTQERQHAVLAGSRFGKFQCSSGGSGMTIKENELSFTSGFPSATLAGVLLTRGKWYYEIENMLSSSAPQHGWADLDFVGGSRSGVGVGDDKHSWGYDGARAPRQGLWADGPVNFGARWNIGDICGVAADIENRRLSFSLNGSWERPMGVAAESISFVCGLCPGLTSQGGKVKVNLGETPFAYPMPLGHSSVHDWMQGMRALLANNVEAVPQQPPCLVRSHSAAPHEKMPGTGLRVHSGHTHAILQCPENIISARDGYPSFVAQDVLLSKGHWAFEVEVLSFDAGEKRSRRFHDQDEDMRPSACVGWADKRFFGDYVRSIGVGDDKHSWGWNISETEIVRNCGGSSIDLDGESKPIKVGDILTLTAALHSGCAHLFVNGQFHSSMEDITPAAGLVPALSVRKGIKLQVRFGPGLTHAAGLTRSSAAPPAAATECDDTDLQRHVRTFEDCQPISQWALAHAPSLPVHQPAKLERATSTSPLQRVAEEDLVFDASTSTTSADAPSLSPPHDFASQSAQASRLGGASQRTGLHLQQLRLSAQLALADGCGDDDAEMQSLLQLVMAATARRLGADIQ